MTAHPRVADTSGHQPRQRCWTGNSSACSRPDDPLKPSTTGGFPVSRVAPSGPPGAAWPARLRPDRPGLVPAVLPPSPAVPPSLWQASAVPSCCAPGMTSSRSLLSSAPPPAACCRGSLVGRRHRPASGVVRACSPPRSVVGDRLPRSAPLGPAPGLAAALSSPGRMRQKGGDCPGPSCSGLLCPRGRRARHGQDGGEPGVPACPPARPAALPPRIADCRRGRLLPASCPRGPG